MLFIDLNTFLQRLVSHMSAFDAQFVDPSTTGTIGTGTFESITMGTATTLSSETTSKPCFIPSRSIFRLRSSL